MISVSLLLVHLISAVCTGIHDDDDDDDDWMIVIVNYCTIKLLYASVKCQVVISLLI